MSQQSNLAVSEQIEQQTHPVGTADMLFSGGMLERLETFSKMMAQGKSTLPKHLQGSEADCMAVVMQAAQWKMNPFAVAQKTHIVNGVLGYEAQLVNAVLQSSNSIVGRFHYEYQENNGALECRVGAIPYGETEIVWNEWLNFNQVTVKNSPLWKTNQKQQMGYLQVKNWARQYCPGAILGVYTPDELEEFPSQPGEKDITPPADELNEALAGDVIKKPAHKSADQMINDIKAAQSSKAMQNAVADVELLNDEDKAKVRNAYAEKVELVKQAKQAGQSASITYAEITEKLNNAQNLDDVDVAESLIGEIADETQRKELIGMADNVRKQFGDNTNMFGNQ